MEDREPWPREPWRVARPTKGLIFTASYSILPGNGRLGWGVMSPPAPRG
jgi:hypothetical protein